VKSNYETLLWIRESSGKEYACYADNVSPKNNGQVEIKDEDIKRCFDVKGIVGIDKW